MTNNATIAGPLIVVAIRIWWRWVKNAKAKAAAERDND